MSKSAVEVLQAILDNPKDIGNVRSWTSPDVTYVSLNYSNPELKRVMPWCGTAQGPEVIVKTFVDVGLLDRRGLRAEGRVRFGRACRDVRQLHLSVGQARQAGDLALLSLCARGRRQMRLPAVHGRHVGDHRVVPQGRRLDHPQRSRRRRDLDLTQPGSGPHAGQNADQFSRILVVAAVGAAGTSRRASCAFATHCWFLPSPAPWRSLPPRTRRRSEW